MVAFTLLFWYCIILIFQFTFIGGSVWRSGQLWGVGALLPFHEVQGSGLGGWQVPLAPAICWPCLASSFLIPSHLAALILHV